MLIKEVLPVMDNLEMAISHSRDENSVQALREGVELTLKGLRDILGKSGLEEVKAEGELFDPNYHHAVSEQADENVEAGIILQELQRGYTLNKRLIRPAMVIVSKGDADDKER
jgi:molecular chaperone GrpE